VSFRLSCAHVAEKTVAVGDHVVVFGKVIDVDHGLEAEDSGSKPSAPSLLYVEGGYSRAAGR
jgi:flavin reductase (DIM6/NTAB) family NADH-FMN oxidoreductase RutF